MRRQAFLATTASVTALASARPSGAQSLQSIAIGITPTDDATPILYAQQAGLLRKAGFNATIEKVVSGTATLTAVLGGTYQFGATSAIAYVSAHAKGLPFELVAPGGLYNSTTDFVWTLVRKDAPYQTARDFNGRTFGVPAVSDLNTIAFLGWMEANGGDPKSVKVFEVPYSVIVPAIEQGRIDAGTLIQPQLGLALRDAKVRGFAKTYDAISTHFYITCWLTTSSFASANPDAVRRFAGVMREAEIYCNAHKADTAEMLANFSAIDLDTVKGGGRDVYGASYLDVNNLQPVIDACVRYKVIDKRFDATDLISAAVRGLH